MDEQRRLHLVGDDECVLRLVSKPDGEEAPPVQGRMATVTGDRRRRDPVRKGPRDLNVIFMFFRALPVNGLVVQLSFVSYHSVPLWGVVFVRYL